LRDSEDERFGADLPNSAGAGGSATHSRGLRFLSRAENLQALTPDWLDFRILKAPAELSPGVLTGYRLLGHRFPIRWRSKISDWQPPYGFRDSQIAGPYACWVHDHRFVAEGDGTQI
jgi:ligand-binding SRPBCC domain-containing protein